MLLDWMAQIMIVKQVISRGLWLSKEFIHRFRDTSFTLSRLVFFFFLLLQLFPAHLSMTYNGSFCIFWWVNPHLKLCRPANFGGRSIRGKGHDKSIQSCFEWSSSMRDRWMFWVWKWCEWYAMASVILDHCLRGSPPPPSSSKHKIRGHLLKKNVFSL